MRLDLVIACKVLSTVLSSRCKAFVKMSFGLRHEDK